MGVVYLAVQVPICFLRARHVQCERDKVIGVGDVFMFVDENKI